MKKRYQFSSELTGTTLFELGYEQIDADARFIFDRPITITSDTLIEFDGRAGTFTLIGPRDERELLLGKWDR